MYAVQAMRDGKKDVWSEAFRNYLLEINEYEHVIEQAGRISETQKRIFMHMSPFEPSTPKMIAKKSGVSQTTIPVQLQRLVQNKGLRK